MLRPCVCVYVSLVDMWFGFEVCILSSFGPYFMSHLQGGIVVVDFLNFRAAPSIELN